MQADIVEQQDAQAGKQDQEHDSPPPLQPMSNADLNTDPAPSDEDCARSRLVVPQTMHFEPATRRWVVYNAQPEAPRRLSWTCQVAACGAMFDTIEKMGFHTRTVHVGLPLQPLPQHPPGADFCS